MIDCIGTKNYVISILGLIMYLLFTKKRQLTVNMHDYIGIFNWKRSKTAKYKFIQRLFESLNHNVNINIIN